MADETGGTGGATGGTGGTVGGTGGATGGTGGTGGGGTGGTGGATAPWHGVSEPADIAIIETKGWKTPADIYKSYRGAESLLGKDPSTLLTIPRADDAAGFRAAMTRLGMPETADKYEIDIPKGADPAYGNWARESFHKLGLTATQAKELVKANNEFVAKAQADSQKVYDTQYAADKQTLLREWGGGLDRMMNSAQTAFKSLGMKPEIVDAIERSIGYAETMKYFAALGQRMSESDFIGGDGGSRPGFGTMTPAEATTEWNKLKVDKDFKSALFDNMHPGHKEAKLRQANLFNIMHAESK